MPIATCPACGSDRLLWPKGGGTVCGACGWVPPKLGGLDLTAFERAMLRKIVDAVGIPGEAFGLPPRWVNMPEPLPPPQAPGVWPVYLIRTNRRLGVYRGFVPEDGDDRLRFQRPPPRPSFHDYNKPDYLPRPSSESIVRAYIDRERGWLWVDGGADLWGVRDYEPE